MSGGGGSSTQKADPWSGQQEPLRQLYSQAQGLQQQQYFPGSTVTPQSPETLQALNLQADQARSGGVGAPQQLAQTLGGDYLYGGPGFDAAMGAAQRTITPMVQGQFEKAGRFGGGLAKEAETSALADAFAGLYGQERQRQMQAAAMAPSVGYSDIAALSQVGGQREMFEQQMLQDQLNRWNFEQQSPYNRLAAQSQIIQGGFPGGSVTDPINRNRGAGALGGALSGAAMGTSIMPGWGTAIGAIGGGIMGAL
jgi:hypothetical protein